MEARMTNKEATVQFLLEEYRNIAQTHDKLRDVGMRLMYYVLILSAFPFTLAGFVFQHQEFDMFAAPLSLYLLFLIVGLSILVLAFSILDARLGQYRYARTVNEIRRYFAENDPGLEIYLYLPRSKEIPDMNKLGFVGTQFFFIVPIGAIFTAYGFSGFLDGFLFRLGIGLLTIAVYIVLFWLVRKLYSKNYEKAIGHC
jgi:hypothetical protein